MSTGSKTRPEGAQPSVRLMSFVGSNGDRSRQREESNARVTTCWPSIDTVAMATPIPPSDARRSISNAPRSRIPLIIIVGAVVSRTVSVAERKFTPAAGTSHPGAVVQLRLSST